MTTTQTSKWSQWTATHLPAAYLREASVIEVRGNTYAHRDLLRSAGFAWDKEAKVWRIKGFRGTMRARGEMGGTLFTLVRRGCELRWRS